MKSSSLLHNGGMIMPSFHTPSSVGEAFRWGYLEMKAALVEVITLAFDYSFQQSACQRLTQPLTGYHLMFAFSVERASGGATLDTAEIDMIDERTTPKVDDYTATILSWLRGDNIL